MSQTVVLSEGADSHRALAALTLICFRHLRRWLTGLLGFDNQSVLRDAVDRTAWLDAEFHIMLAELRYPRSSQASRPLFGFSLRGALPPFADMRPACQSTEVNAHQGCKNK